MLTIILSYITLANIVQFAILVFSAGAISCLTSANKKIRLWGSIFGLLGQPLWFYTSYMAGQWAVLILAIWYTRAYIKGIMNNKSNQPGGY